MRYCERCGDQIYQALGSPWCQNCIQDEEETRYCYLCSMQHRASEPCPCSYCGSKQHPSSECTSCSANINRYLGETMPNTREMRGYPCEYCKVIQPPHKEDCPKTQPSKPPIPKIISPQPEYVKQGRGTAICKVC